MNRAHAAIVAVSLVGAFAACRDDKPFTSTDGSANQERPSFASQASLTAGVSHYFGPEGTAAGGSGTLQSPWTLPYAFAHAPAGDTVWLLGGPYTGPFSVSVPGVVF